jgi:hypothetical protein
MSRVRTTFPLLALSPLLFACASLTSTTQIDPDKSFRLGGGQPGAFVVKGKNAGAVPIIVYAERDGKRDSVVTVAPGASVDARFPARSTAIFMNISSDRQAVVAVKVTGDVGALGMRYESNAKANSDSGAKR